MSPEYGATMGYFAVDEETLDYMALTGRDEEKIGLVQEYLSRQNLFGIDIETEVEYSQVIELDLSTLSASLAGPKRPQDRVPLSELKNAFQEIAMKPVADGGYGLNTDDLDKKVLLDGWKDADGQPSELRTGDVVLAAITSCTNTSNPSVMIGAGLVAKKAVEAGLSVPNYVKTSLTPGSLVVTEYLKKANVLESLERLGFNVAGYGCATCIGNSGPLDEPVTKAIVDNDMLVGSVLSGNRNFEGRIHQHIKANYLASPMLVVAYALAGTLDIDFDTQAIGKNKDGNEVFLKDLWPSNSELSDAVNKQYPMKCSLNNIEVFMKRTINGMLLMHHLECSMNGKKIQHIFASRSSLKILKKWNPLKISWELKFYYRWVIRLRQTISHRQEVLQQNRRPAFI